MCRSAAEATHRLWSLNRIGEMFGQPLPTLKIVMLQFGGLAGVAREPNGVAAFEHECHRILELLRLEFGMACPLPGFGIRSMRAHTIVQAGAAGQEALGLGVINALQETLNSAIALR